MLGGFGVVLLFLSRLVWTIYVTGCSTSGSSGGAQNVCIIQNQAEIAFALAWSGIGLLIAGSIVALMTNLALRRRHLKRLATAKAMGVPAESGPSR